MLVKGALNKLYALGAGSSGRYGIWFFLLHDVPNDTDNTSEYWLDTYFMGNLTGLSASDRTISSASVTLVNNSFQFNHVFEIPDYVIPEVHGLYHLGESAHFMFDRTLANTGSSGFQATYAGIPSAIIPSSVARIPGFNTNSATGWSYVMVPKDFVLPSLDIDVTYGDTEDDTVIHINDVDMGSATSFGRPYITSTMLPQMPKSLYGLISSLANDGTVISSSTPSPDAETYLTALTASSTQLTSAGPSYNVRRPSTGGLRTSSTLVIPYNSRFYFSWALPTTKTFYFPFSSDTHAPGTGIYSLSYVGRNPDDTFKLAPRFGSDTNNDFSNIPHSALWASAPISMSYVMNYPFWAQEVSDDVFQTKLYMRCSTDNGQTWSEWVSQTRNTSNIVDLFGAVASNTSIRNSVPSSNYLTPQKTFATPIEYMAYSSGTETLLLEGKLANENAGSPLEGESSVVQRSFGPTQVEWFDNLKFDAGIDDGIIYRSVSADLWPINPPTTNPYLMMESSPTSLANGSQLVYSPSTGQKYNATWTAQNLYLYKNTDPQEPLSLEHRFVLPSKATGSQDETVIQANTSNPPLDIEFVGGYYIRPFSVLAAPGPTMQSSTWLRAFTGTSTLDPNKPWASPSIYPEAANSDQSLFTPPARFQSWTVSSLSTQPNDTVTVVFNHVLSTVFNVYSSDVSRGFGGTALYGGLQSHLETRYSLDGGNTWTDWTLSGQSEGRNTTYTSTIAGLPLASHIIVQGRQYWRTGGGYSPVDEIEIDTPPKAPEVSYSGQSISDMSMSPLVNFNYTQGGVDLTDGSTLESMYRFSVDGGQTYSDWFVFATNSAQGNFTAGTTAVTAEALAQTLPFSTAVLFEFMAKKTTATSEVLMSNVESLTVTTADLPANALTLQVGYDALRRDTISITPTTIWVSTAKTLVISVADAGSGTDIARFATTVSNWGVLTQTFTYPLLSSGGTADLLPNHEYTITAVLRNDAQSRTVLTTTQTVTTPRPILGITIDENGGQKYITDIATTQPQTDLTPSKLDVSYKRFDVK